MAKQITVTITISEEKPGLWVAVTHDVLDVDGTPIGITEDTPSWVLSHICEDIVERLNTLRDSGNDWHGE